LQLESLTLMNLAIAGSLDKDGNKKLKQLAAQLKEAVYGGTNGINPGGPEGSV
jgi:hypothetical protein